MFALTFTQRSPCASACDRYDNLLGSGDKLAAGPFSAWRAATWQLRAGVSQTQVTKGQLSSSGGGGCKREREPFAMMEQFLQIAFYALVRHVYLLASALMALFRLRAAFVVFVFERRHE